MKVREFGLTNFAVDNLKTVYIFTSILIVLGIWSYTSTPKEMTPDIVFPYFSITTIYPGTSPSDMENLVTRHIEKQLKGISGIKKVSSKSIQDFSMIFVEFETTADIDRAYQDVTEAVDKSKTDLPTGLLDDPDVTRIELSEFPILNINLSGDLGLVKLKEYAEELQDEIESLEEITRVDIIGALDREIQINVDLYKMQAVGVSFAQIQNAVAMENMTISGGQIKMDGMERTMRIIGEFTHADQVKNIILKDGVYLTDVADVVDGYADKESYARLFGEDVITLNVIKRGGKNLINAVDKINVILDDFKEEAPENLVIKSTGDQSTMTRNIVRNLFNTIILGFIVVVLVLMFFMGVENALFVGIAIPLSMLISFTVIYASGYTMNMVVLMAYILVLGIVVDNSIVVIENIYRHYMNTPNLPIAPASKIGAGEVAVPVFTGTLTTMAPFFPLLFWPGIFGEFMMYIPVTIIITLAASMLVAYAMNPVFAVSFMKYKKDQPKDARRNRKILLTTGILVILAVLFHLAGVTVLGNLLSFAVIVYLLIKYVLIPLIKKFQAGFIPRMMNGYKKLLSFLLVGRRSYYVVLSTVSLLILTFFLMGVASPKIILFPESDPSTIYVYIKMPAGTAIEVTDSITHEVENKVLDVLGRDNKDVESVISNVAIGAGESVFERSTQPNLGKVTVTFVEYEFRKGPPTGTYLNALREQITGIPGVEIAINKETMGPPAGKPINIEIHGEDIKKLIAISERLDLFIDSINIPGIEELKSDMDVNNPEILINIDRVKANKMGINTAFVGMTIRNALYGVEVSKYREGEDEYDIRLRLKENFRRDINALLNMKMVLPGGQNGAMRKIPISSFAVISMQSSYGGIIRIDNERVITLSSNVLSGYNANEIVQKLKVHLKNFKLGNDYKIVFTGEQEEQAENMNFLGMALFLAIALIFMILVTQFNSLSKPLIILSQVLFSIIGVLLGTIIFRMDMSIIMTGMGIIAVAGIVVKNAIILIDYTDILIAKGGRIREALVQAGATRLTPVLLTAASTILGLLPLAIGMNFDFAGLFSQFDPNIYFGGDSAAFWKPLSLTIIFGLSFATLLTLLVVPSMYFIVQAGKVKIKRTTTVRSYKQELHDTYR